MKISSIQHKFMEFSKTLTEYSFMAAKTINKNNILLAVILQDILFLFSFNHWSGGSICSGAYRCPQKTLKRFSAHPKEGFTSLPLLLYLQQRSNAEPPARHPGQQHTKENSEHEQKVPFTTSIKSLPCSATSSSSLACFLSLPHQGSHTSSINLPLPQHDLYPGWNISPQTVHVLPTFHPCTGPHASLTLHRSLPLSSSGSDWSP